MRPLYNRLFLCLMFILSGCMPHSRQTYTPVEFVEETPLSPPVVSKPIQKPLVVVDAGHGGEDFGTKASSQPRCYEKNLNLSTAHMLKNFLQQMGFQVVMTRDDDIFVSLGDRAQIANRLKPILFVSVHYNSAPNEKASGIEVFYYDSDKDNRRTESSKKLAQAVLDHVIDNTKAKSRGVKHGNLAVIRETNMPAILVEGGFLTNESETQKLRDSQYLKGLAWGIAQGIQDFVDAKARN